MEQNKKGLLLGQIELCFCALSLVLALFVGISPISNKAKIRFMYVGAALSLIAVPMRATSHKVNHKLPQRLVVKPHNS